MSSGAKADKEIVRQLLEVYFKAAGLSWGNRPVNDSVASELALMIIATKKCSNAINTLADSLVGVVAFKGKGILKKIAEKLTIATVRKVDSELSYTCVRVIVAARQSKLIIASLTG